MKCERCNETFTCSANNPEVQCWCVDMPKLKPIPEQFKDCLCPKCLYLFIEDADTEKQLT